MNPIHYIHGNNIPNRIRPYASNANDSKRAIFQFTARDSDSYPPIFLNKKNNFPIPIELDYIDDIPSVTRLARSGTDNNYAVTFARPRSAIIHSFSNRIISFT